LHTHAQMPATENPDVRFKMGCQIHSSLCSVTSLYWLNMSYAK